MCALGLLTFVLLALRFAPNWPVFYEEYRSALSQAPDAAHQTAVRAAFQGTIATARGAFVVRQAADLSTEIGELNHKIVRWRLLVPALGHFLRLPAVAVLGLAFAGCFALVFALTGLALKNSGGSRAACLDALCLGLVGGATAPFITSMGWLGYYDAWLALAFLAVAFARSRNAVVLACVLAPWIDERFVLGLPLALGVRWAASEPAERWSAWFRREALVPFALVTLFALFRLSLGGSGGSQTVGGYLRTFAVGRHVTPSRILFGLWTGLRFAWIPLVMIAVAAWWTRSIRAALDRRHLLVALLAVGTVILGLTTAFDLSRSVILLFPLVPLGWMLAQRAAWWRTWRIAPALAVLAVALPAHHVTTQFAIAADNFWSPPSALAEATNNLGRLYATDTSGPRDPAAALQWYRKGAAIGPPEQQYNLGVALERGLGVPVDDVEADRWYRAAAERGYSPAESNLGSMYVRGAGVPRDPREAAKWFKLAARQGDIVGETDLAELLARGDGVGKEPAEAARLYRDAAAHNYAPAETALASLYATGTGVEPDASQAVFWYRKAAEQGFAEAQVDLGALYADGNGVPPDPAQAVQWFQRAAEHGYVPAEVDLGVMYVKGAGVAQDEVEALAWFDLAADARDPKAIKFRDFLAQHLEPGKVLDARERSKGLVK